MDWIAPLITLTAMEIVLGIDNVIFIAILVQRLPPEKQEFGRRAGLGLALFARLALLFAINWIMGLIVPVFTWSDLGLTNWGLPADWFAEPEVNEVTLKDLILFGGGLFLIGKSVHELHAKLEGEHGPSGAAGGTTSMGAVLIQIALIDIVFSLDSVITAVGMAKDVTVMVVAMVIAVGVMVVFAGAISKFVNRHPTLKVLALSFLILIGSMLVAEGMGVHFPRGYLYFAMSFALVVEMMNLRLRTKANDPVALHEPPPVDR